MLTNFKNGDKDFQLMQSSWATDLNPVIQNPLVNGIYLKGTSLVAGSNQIAHKLGRQYQGWINCGILNSTSTSGSWVSYTPTGTWNTNTTYGGVYRAIGDQLQCKVTLGFSGAPNAINLFFSQSEALPSGYTIDTTKFPLYSATAAANKSFEWNVGTWTAVDNGNANYGGFVMWDADANVFRILTSTSPTASVSPTVPFTWGSMDCMDINIQVPIAAHYSSALWEGTSIDPTKFINIVSNGPTVANIYVF